MFLNIEQQVTMTMVGLGAGPSSKFHIAIPDVFSLFTQFCSCYRCPCFLHSVRRQLRYNHLPITVNMSLVPFLLKRSELPLNSDFVVQPFQESMTVGIFYVDIKLP